ncbi:hypothetical protein [Defluviitalea saccharophila]|uniref:Uncharacterized protein n=1 Tax=Defluviitalea saccharophila TaxID=879970 RepID=A0ABZ2Y565_9FIRM|nr:hypothetical protein [Candidatus Epulonipiscium sp.]
MEKRKRNSRSNIRRRFRNQKNNTKELMINLLLKQLGASIFMFLLLIILQFAPLRTAEKLVQRINFMISYNMSWDEAIETVKNTAVQIPVVKNWVEKDESNDRGNEQRDFSDPMVDEEEVPAMHLEDSYEDNETVNQENEIDSEEIFILEPDLGEPEEATTP